MTHRGREVRLHKVPRGVPGPDSFLIADVEVGEPVEGELLVRNQWMSLDPAMRVRMGGSGGSIGAVPNYEIGQALDGMAVGEVLASTVAGYEPGDLVVHSQGWRDYARPRPDTPGHRVAKIPADEPLPPQSYLGLLSLVGFTAYVGLYLVGGLERDETVWVSAAGGAVGSLAVQIAKLNGSRVVASAGSADKVAYLRDVLGADEAFDYHDGPVGELLGKAAPDGIDVYFENVGGEHLTAALDALRPGGRIALCGLVSSYNAAEPPPGPTNLFAMVSKGITMTGFLAVQYAQHMAEYRDLVRGWLAEGRLDYRETVTTGLENAPQALIDALAGRTVGKVLVDLR
ncbi:hypothetical protein SAMN05443575_3228 [Jatrophihabitans endophyticus]|uniref:Enoyl reductase (ER) domain-containing protein n=1 Tax=Jatrophihabitans endophyticus TaxID=1206085 RepID=A0A1M5PYE9_9ACTN|nr:NADP-dependent oxidoreductase [Jatrophihabitans endophyticus]SHH06541.1 hypothetical protein SAMN05443575_3228 [Jatrophihabitans endophyticus]